MRPPNSYVICTSPRSGSTLLCRLLREVGNAGFPESHFHAPSLEKWLGHYGLGQTEFSTRQDALKAVLKSAQERGRGASDIFGLRLQRHSFDFFIEQLCVLYPSLPNDNSRIDAAFGKTLFVHLTRENKLDQAISYVKAKQSGLWHMAPDGTELERLSEPKEPIYDATAIAAQLALSEQMETDWKAWFAKEQIKPMQVTYGELSAAPYATLGRILKALGLESGTRDEVTPPVAKMADATNREWAKRFRSETRS
jgi:LPS sulfotransferase NodH